MEISGAIADSVQVLLHSWDQAWVARDLQSIPGVASAKIAVLTLQTDCESPKGRVSSAFS
jgi:hypothetical protein